MHFPASDAWQPFEWQTGTQSYFSSPTRSTFPTDINTSRVIPPQRVFSRKKSWERLAPPLTRSPPPSTVCSVFLGLGVRHGDGIAAFAQSVVPFGVTGPSRPPVLRTTRCRKQKHQLTPFRPWSCHQHSRVPPTVWSARVPPEIPASDW